MYEYIFKLLYLRADSGTVIIFLEGSTGHTVVQSRALLLIGLVRGLSYITILLVPLYPKI